MFELESGIIIDTFGGCAPVQAFGEIGGEPFYFRARGIRWTLIIAKTGSDPVSAFAGFGDSKILFEDSGVYDLGDGGYSASYMPSDRALGLIRRCGRIYLASCNKMMAV